MSSESYLYSVKLTLETPYATHFQTPQIFDYLGLSAGYRFGFMAFYGRRRGGNDGAYAVSCP
ncbi:hypothetical protein NBRC116601_14680 [Cognatishimia sp. WU-CL00825]